MDNDLCISDGCTGVEAAEEELGVAGLFQELHLLVDEGGRFGAASVIRRIRKRSAQDAQRVAAPTAAAVAVVVAEMMEVVEVEVLEAAPEC